MSNPTAANSGSAQSTVDFKSLDRTRVEFTLESITGAGGLLLGFPGDVWNALSLYRIFTLQRYAAKLQSIGLPIALVVRDRAKTLENFHTGSPLPIPFLLLSDADSKIHTAYGMSGGAGIVLIDSTRALRRKWTLTDEVVLPSLNDITAAAQSLQNAVARAGH